MKPPKVWGQGQIFAYSGLDGKTDKENGLCGYLCGDKLGIQFKIPMECEPYFTDVRFRSLEFTDGRLH